MGLSKNGFIHSSKKKKDSYSSSCILYLCMLLWSNYATTVSTSLIVPSMRLICVFLMPIQYDQDFHPGRRKRGKDYKEGMVN
jgi:hypothetical protein